VSDLSTELTGALGARVRLVDGVAWLVNGGRGVRAPNAQDLAAVGTRSKGNFQVPNLELSPEHSYTSDTGFDVDFPRWSARAVLFLVEHRDAIVLGPTTVDGASVAPDGSLYVHSINAATVRVHGAEGSINAEVLPRVTLWLRRLLMLGLQRNPAGTEAPRETYADRIPPHQGELGLWYEPTRWKLGAFLSARERQDRLNDPINTGDNRIPADGTPGFLTLHLRAMLRATDDIRVRLALDNVTNELVLEHGNGFYGAGFSGTLGAEVVLR